MTIRVVYHAEPTFPATDQHPQAQRYQIGGYWVDAVDGEPTLAEVMAVVSPPKESAEANGRGLDIRQRKAAKEEASALIKQGDTEGAFNKLLELI